MLAYSQIPNSTHSHSSGHHQVEDSRNGAGFQRFLDGAPSPSGMTRIQLLILMALTVLIIALSLPPWLEYRKVMQADSDVTMIAMAIQKYFRHTGAYPQKLEELITNPGIAGWKGSYLESLPQTPWGGSYQMLRESYKVCIPANYPRVPAKYQFGGIAEISHVYLEGEEGSKYWW